MMLLLAIAMVASLSWGLFNYVSARGGSPWFWACLVAVGYAIAELSVCYSLRVSPREYFLSYFPNAGLLWMILVIAIARMRFRRRTVGPSA
jgi:hypothetical protein